MASSIFEQGGWIFSRKALVHASMIKQRYDSKIMDHIEAQTGNKQIRYNPWMSYFFNKPGQAEAIFKTGEVTAKPEILLNNSATLDRLNLHLADNSGILCFTSGSENVPAELDVNCSISKPWFGERLGTAIELLRNSDPLISSYVDTFLVQVVPFIATHLKVGSRCLFSTHRVKGAVFVQYSNQKPVSSLIDAIDLFHEIGHQVLIYYFTADRITTSDPEILVYSGARRTKRPAIRAFHSAMALTFMAISGLALRTKCLGEKDIAFLNEHIATYQEALKENLNSLRELLSFTILGDTLLNEMAFFANYPLKGGTDD
jgi:hypothetical protein